MEHKVIYWLWLSLALGAGCKNSSEIIDACDCDAHNLYDDELFKTTSAKKVLTTRQIGKLKDKDLTKAKEISDYCNQNAIKIITPDSQEYPKNLLKISSCPFVLYLRGNLPSFTENISIACVGTRKMTEVGKRCAYEFAYDLAKSGIIITSGMALGIDSICHRAALDAHGYTVAVLGSGIDIVYPPQNEDLYHEICEKGAVISEFAPGTPPLGHNFPVRNRIVSGLCAGTLVIEAGERSGSLNTAHHAAEQGKDIFSIPGPNGEYNNRGSNSLLKEGAKPVTEAVDIVNFYSERYGSQIKFNHIQKRKSLQGLASPETKSINSVKKTKNKKIEKEENNLTQKDEVQACSISREELVSLGEPMRSVALSLLDKELFPEEISQVTNIPFNNVLRAISLLELQGIVKKISGGKFTIK